MNHEYFGLFRMLFCSPHMCVHAVSTAYPLSYLLPLIIISRSVPREGGGNQTNRAEPQLNAGARSLSASALLCGPGYWDGGCYPSWYHRPAALASGVSV